MRGARGVVLIVGLLAVLAIGPMAALADPGNGHGKPTPSPSPTESPSPSPEPTASWRDGSSSNDTGTAPAPDGTADASGGGGGGGGGSGGGSANGSSSEGETMDHGGSGIIKLDRRPFDRAPNNEPKVACTFQVDFYNYPAEVTARYTFLMWPPTGHRQELAGGSIALDDDPAGGGQDLDGAATVDLGPALIETGIEPHQRQGWHVKVAVRARHTSGSDQKQKVFWVRECRAEQPPSAPPTTPPPAPTTVTPPEPIAFTGSNAMRLAGLMLLLFCLGTAAMRVGRRLEDAS